MVTPEPTPTVPAEASKPDLANDIRQWVGKADQLIKEAVHTGSQDIDQARTQLEAKICSAKDNLQETATSLSEKARLAGIATEKFVIANPWKSLGIMTLVGMAIGAFRPRR